MADVKFRTVQFALDSTLTAGQTQDVTISGFGTPKAAIFILSDVTANDTVTADQTFAIGFTDGTRENCCAIKSTDGVTSSATFRRSTSGACILPEANNLQFSFNSWITDGVRLNVDNDAPADYLCTCILIGGADVAGAYANFHNDLGTSAGTTAITGVGFEPDLVFMTGIGNTTSTGSSDHTIFSFGAAHNGTGITQRSTLFNSVTGQGTTSGTARLGNDSIAGQVFSGSLTWRGGVTAFGSDGFSVTTNSGAGADVVFFLALQFTNSPDVALFDTSIPTTGNYAETTPGFEPDFGLISGLVGPSSRNSTTSTGGLYTNFLTAFDSSNISTHNASDQDAVGTMVSKSLTSQSLGILNYDGSTTEVASSGYAFDADGWDFTLTTNPASQPVLGWGLAIGPASGGGGGTTVDATTASVSATPFAATVNAKTAITATTASASVSTFAASVGVGLTIAAATASMSLAASPATVNDATTITTTQATANVSTFQASVLAGQTINADTAAISTNTFDATVNDALAITAEQAAISASTFDATVNDALAITAEQAAVSASPFAASITVGADVSISATLAVGSITAHPATVNDQTTITATLAAASLSPLLAEVSTGLNITASQAGASLTAYPASVTSTLVIQGTLASVSLSPFRASVTESGTVVVTTPAARVYTIPAQTREFTVSIRRREFIVYG